MQWLICIQLDGDPSQLCRGDDMLFSDLSGDIIRAEIAKERREVVDQYEQIRERLKDFHEDRQTKNEYIRDWGFKLKDGSTDLPLQSVNITAKIINKISLTYKYQPKRMLMDIEGDDDALALWYAGQPEFALGFKYAERYKNLLGKILYRVHYDARRQTWFPFIETHYEAHFLEDDMIHPIAYSYPLRQDLTESSAVKEDWWIFWSDEDYFFYIPGTDKRKEDEFGGENPFGIMPMVEMRSDYPVDQYDTTGAWSLILANQNINIAMNDLNLMIHHQAFDQPWISGASKEEATGMELGANRVLTSTDSEVSFGLLSYSPKITECIEAVKFQIQSVAYTYNLAINWSIEGNPASGFSLLVQNIDLLEARHDDVELAVLYEKQMYKVLSSMQEHYKRHAMLPKDEPVLPMDGKVSVDFTEIDFPINQKEEQDRWDWLIDQNAKTVIDLIMSLNPDMSEDEAIEKYQRNKELNGTLTPAEVAQGEFEALGGEVV